jgi:hypothetical protein
MIQRKTSLYVLAGLAILIVPSVYTVITGAAGGGIEYQICVRVLMMLVAGAVCAAAAGLAWLLPVGLIRGVVVVAVYAAAAFLLVEFQDAVARLLVPVLPQNQEASSLANMRGPLYFPYIILAHMFIAGNAMRLAARVRERQIVAERLDRSIAEAQLHMLELQLDPADVVHVLHRIKDLMHSDPAAAIEEIASLGDRLRERLHSSPK